MSHYYLDASALVKRYVDEVGSICEVIDLIDKRVEFPLPLCHLRPWTPGLAIKLVSVPVSRAALRPLSPRRHGRH